MDSKRILVLAPHPEDGELGCGATMARHVEAGRDVFYVAFTIAEKSTHPPFRPDEQKYELQRAMEILGLDPKNLVINNWDVRTFGEHRQEILDYMLTLRRDLKPDLVFCHSRDDSHQDHQCITAEAVRAFKLSSILGYELPWNNFQFRTDYFSMVSADQAAKKVAALACYQSRGHRPYLAEDKLRAWLTMRGLQIETDFAECFEVIRLIDRG